MLRTHTCGELNAKEAGAKVVLCGWVDSFRAHGKIGFISLRDRYGVTQVVCEKELLDVFKTLSRESVLKVTGVVRERPKHQANPTLPTGSIEISASELTVLNLAEPLPLELSHIKSTEDTRLQYRYLDLRTPKIQQNLITRYNIIKTIRDLLHEKGFTEIETPLLAKSTPEGARDYVVPSRVHKGKFFALPQSPQLFKQLLMIAGFDKYFQIARCLRDEDLRADRQPEFTQLDMEMSFIQEADIMGLVEELVKCIWKKFLNVELKIPFPRINYDEVIKKYKSDKPDLRKQRKEEFAFLWVIDFPMFEYSEEEKRLVAMHHPFTSPKEEQVHLLEKNPEKAKARAYDLVLNGVEVAGGSIRIHSPELQKKIFKVLQLSDKEAEEKFGFFLKALRYGTPPHGGIAFGLDRLIAIITKNESIREVIAFPKNKEAKDLMIEAPSGITQKQLDELGIKVK